MGVRPNPSRRDNVLIDVINQTNVDLDSWTQEKISSINSREGSKITQLNPLTLSGNPAYKVEYSWLGDRIMELWTTVGSKIYSISYVAEEATYRTNLPHVENMIASFSVGTAERETSESVPAPPLTSKSTTPVTTNGNGNAVKDSKGSFCLDTNGDRICDKTFIPKKGEFIKEQGIKPQPGNNSCNYYGLNVCSVDGQCDDQQFDCYSDDCVNGQPGTTGQCDGDDDKVCWVNGEYTGKCDPKQKQLVEAELPPCDGSYQDCITPPGWTL
jgi:hypothetical protein